MTDSRRLKHPIVLVHGLGARGAYGPFDYFHGLPKLLKNAGNRFFVAKLTAWNSIEWRAEQLKTQIEAVFADEKINLIGHSMGGLDSRYLTSSLGFADRVASVTTIGTPNRGSIISDLALDRVGETAFMAANRLLSTMGFSTDGLKQLSRKYQAETLAPQIANVAGVGYFSATSAIPAQFMKHSLPLFWLPHRMLQNHEGDNDGFVSVESARWGEHICTYRGDHYAQIGQFLGRSRGLDYLGFYGEILDRLHREGF